LSNELSVINRIWNSGEVPDVTWDLRNIRSGKINIAAVSFFLAITQRIRQFTGVPQKCLLDWNPKTFGFLSDIGFFKLADENDLIEWPYEIGGYQSGKTNPNTKLLAYSPLLPRPSLARADDISHFKKIHREAYGNDIMDNCEALFVDNDYASDRYDLPLVLSRVSAELATNAILWGNSPAFIGLQRTSNNITISISDIGDGFKKSLSEQSCVSKYITENISDIKAIAIGCIKNSQEVGLRRAISTLVELDGGISITSYAGEIHWKRSIWGEFINNFSFDDMHRSFDSLPKKIYRVTSEDRRIGYVREWSNSIRGARIQFNLPLNNRS
jgi:hypothetical protein